MSIFATTHKRKTKMATIEPQFTRPDDGVLMLLWEGVVTGDTIHMHQVEGTAGAIANVQVTGTFGGATVSFAGSNDGVNFVVLKDLSDAAIALTSPGMVDFSTAALFVKPIISGGSGNDVDVTAVLRG